MFAAWINETVRAFGHQLGLKNFALNERGAAGCTFENGFRMRLEAIQGGLIVSVGVPADSEPATMKKLLSAAHPAARAGRAPYPGSDMRAVWMASSGEARFLLRLGERELTVSALEATFRTLWSAADYFGRSLA